MTTAEQFKNWLETEYYSAKNKGPISSGTNYVQGIMQINWALNLKGVLKPQENLLDLKNISRIKQLYDIYMALPERHKDYSSHFQAFLHFKEISLEKNRQKNVNRIFNQQNPLKKQQVEIAAVDFVTHYFSNKNYMVSSKEKDNLGWDLEAVNHQETLLLEVKGLSGKTISIDLTPNEYEKSQYNKNYRICIVINALDKPSLFIFEYIHSTNKWTSLSGQELILTERIAARLTY